MSHINEIKTTDMLSDEELARQLQELDFEDMSSPLDKLLYSKTNNIISNPSLHQIQQQRNLLLYNEQNRSKPDSTTTLLNKKMVEKKEEKEVIVSNVNPITELELNDFELELLEKTKLTEINKLKAGNFLDMRISQLDLQIEKRIHNNLKAKLELQVKELSIENDRLKSNQSILKHCAIQYRSTAKKLQIENKNLKEQLAIFMK